MPLNIAGSEDESSQTFHSFSRLPPELRLRIWAFAAEAEPRIIDFIQYISSTPPLNGSGDVPTVAKACSEVWHMVMAKGSYWQPAQTDNEKPHLKYWASDTDIFYLREIDPFDERVTAGNLDFLKSRKTVAVDHDDFVTQGSGEDHYSWLRDSEGHRGPHPRQRADPVRIHDDRPSLLVGRLLRASLLGHHRGQPDLERPR
ncbi:hypothetical protein PG993_015259 [Apiospora rasikravindrae]|uniref:2EXR domain-containing protein n=1 Tax=Apiospora rasikravindrae TaxID=990691 RepID=A0ABR1RQ27_9PEZI